MVVRACVLIVDLEQINSEVKMTYYIHIENGQIIGKGQARILNETFLNVEVDEDIYNEIEKYIWDGADLVLDPDYEEKEAQKERERIALLSLTRGDVFRGLLMAKQVTRAEIRAMIENNETLSTLEREMALIDFDEALNFYRGNALIDTLGMTLGITSEQLDQFFMTNDYTVLLPKEEPTETPVDPQENQATSEVESVDDPSLTQEEPKEQPLNEEE